jgi:pyridoxal phosphate-dependent aminotransferase EpsN
MNPPRIYLSPPHMGDAEFEFVREAFATNWIAPLGPQVDAFEKEFAAAVGSPHAAALSSGTAALHLALRLLDVGAGDEVFCSTFSFIASANPIVYQGARPVFIDSDRISWNMDPALLAEALEDRAKRGRPPKAVVLVHLYGQSADIDPIAAACARHGVTLIEDAAEALGAVYHGRQRLPAPNAGFKVGDRQGVAPGTVGKLGVYSFNGNKIITTSGGGMLVSADGGMIARARFLATQARDPAPHYQHSQIGYNYRLSNVLAGIGRGQLQMLEAHVTARRRNCEFYQQALADLPGIAFMPEADYGRCTRWLTCITIDPEEFGADREAVRLALAEQNIEARPVWKPLHLQPVFADCECFGGGVAEEIFARGLCLPSGSNLSSDDLGRVVAVVRQCHRGRKGT